MPAAARGRPPHGSSSGVVVFIAGVTGFIGCRLAAALAPLAAQGVRVIGAAREPPPGGVRIDYTRDHTAAVWRPRLVGVDTVVNAVGIFRERGAATFDAVHARAPTALFQAAAGAGVRRVLQVSALGADGEATAAFLASKQRADDALAALPLSAAIAQPSLVYGPGGASSRAFDALASAPLHFVPAHAARVQPIHIDDLVAALVALLTVERWRTGRIPLVGPAPLGFAAYLAALRRAQGLPPTRAVPVPPALLTVAARVGEMRGALLSRDALALLARDNVAPPDTTQALLGRAPRAATDFVAPPLRAAVRARARLDWLLPPARWAVALTWIVTGIVSLAVYPRAASLDLLARVGLHGALAVAALWAGALLDIALGVAALALRRRAVWWLQLGTMAAYTALISVRLPEYWAHPYGPLLKNVPLAMLIVVLLVFEERRWTT